MSYLKPKGHNEPFSPLLYQIRQAQPESQQLVKNSSTSHLNSGNFKFGQSSSRKRL